MIGADSVRTNDELLFNVHAQAAQDHPFLDHSAFLAVLRYSQINHTSGLNTLQFGSAILNKAGLNLGNY